MRKSRFSESQFLKILKEAQGRSHDLLFWIRGKQCQAQEMTSRTDRISCLMDMI